MRSLQSALKEACWISTIVIAWTVRGSPAPPYDLSQVDGMNGFDGSVEAQELLAKQGFVVAAPEFIQMFQAYIESPVPVFVTPDSAWHTFHIVFEEGVKEMEQAQAQRLVQFSKRLLEAAQVQSTNQPEFQALVAYASVGLAFQDEEHRKAIPAEQKRLLESLLNGTQPVNAPIGFPLSPVQFRPQSFYIESPELSDFYSAHQWYAAVDFRLSNTNETRLALCLSWLVESEPELLRLWKKLTEPYDLFVALPEDGTVTTYHGVARELLSTRFGSAAFDSEIRVLQTKLDSAAPGARINDQYLSPAEYQQFAKLTKGFRLLPGRQLPCGVCFQNTVDPKIPGRMFPSGLDFMAASPVMRSPAALRALEAQFGKPTAQAIQRAECPAMPNSLYGQSMQLLARLQERLPSGVAQPLRTDAWSDLQLWTQLAAWSEQRHTWALYAKNGALYGGNATPPPGVVAPYPAFFAGLGKLARDTAKAFESTSDQVMEPKATAAEMLELGTLVRNNYNGMNEKELAKIQGKTSHYGRFIGEYYAVHQSEINNPLKVNSDLEAMLRHIATNAEPSAAETETLKMYFDTRLVSVPQLNGFAGLCARLAEFAQKQIDGKALDHDEANWVRDYGKIIAGFNGYIGNSWLVPLDDFSLVTRIFDNPLVGSVFYAGVARPQALYVILPYKNRLQLYRGGVLSYREFVRPEDERLDDKSWRGIVAEHKAPPPPAFTQSFLRTGKPDPNQKKAAMTKGLKPGQPGKIKVEVKEVSLGPSPKEWVWHEGWITPSEDCRHVAYRARNAGKWRIFRDGVPGKEYDEAHYQWFSPDGEHLAYLARIGEKWCVVLDEVEGPAFSAIGEITKHYWRFAFSPDDAHLAYVATTENRKQCVVVDGHRGPEFDEIMHHSFSFSEDSKHYAYAATEGTHGVIIKDGKEVLRGDAIVSSVQAFSTTRVGETFGPFLSPDGSRLASSVRRGTNCFVILDGVESGPWDNVNCLVAPREEFARFSPDGSRFAYVGMRKDKYFAVVDQKENAESWMECPIFSPDSRHVAFTSFNDATSKSAVVLDGVRGKEFSGTIEDPVFSPDGKRLAYRVSEGIMGGGFVAEHGGEEFDDYYSYGDILFSPDSQHMAFRGSRNGQTFLVIDGRDHLANDGREGSIHSEYFTFSPDSKQWAYIAQHDEGQYAVISGAEYGPYEFLSAPDEEAYIYFSPDSKHFAFMATRGYRQSNYRGGRQYLVVDGHDYEIPGASWLTGSVLRFDSPTKLHGLIMGPDRIARLEVEIHSE